jgi:hypothetical protein
VNVVFPRWTDEILEYINEAKKEGKARKATSLSYEVNKREVYKWRIGLIAISLK